MVKEPEAELMVAPVLSKVVPVDENVPPFKAMALFRSTAPPAVNTRFSLPDVDDIPALVVMPPAAVKVSVQSPPAVFDMALERVILPVWEPAAPVLIMTEVPALRVLFKVVILSIALSPIAEKVSGSPPDSDILVVVLLDIVTSYGSISQVPAEPLAAVASTVPYSST
jgi:hypothetical protein